MSAKQLVATILVIICSFFSLLFVWALVTQSSDTKLFLFEGSPVSLYEQRFTALRADLQEVEMVGYLDSPDLNVDDAQYHYFLTQYILSPLIVKNSTDSLLIIGNFPNVEGNVLPELAPNLILIQDYGNGVFLLENKDG